MLGRSLCQSFCLKTIKMAAHWIEEIPRIAIECINVDKSKGKVEAILNGQVVKVAHLGYASSLR
jgi:hypothetical protein